MSSTLIRDALVVDGTGADPYVGNVLIREDRVAAMHPSAHMAADSVVQGEGLVLAPGFIDIHTHSDLTRLAYPSGETRILQGITTEVIGNCGLSPVPMAADPDGFRQSIGPIDVAPGIDLVWAQPHDYLDALEALPASTNVAALIGHGSIRQFVMGQQSTVPDDEQLDGMRDAIRQALAAGYWGVSLGLMYSPGEHAALAELIAVADVVKEHDATLSAHMRAYDRDGLPSAVSELIEVAERTGASMQISHLRSVADPQGEALDRALRMLQETEANISADAYPYVAGHTSIVQLFPVALRARGAGAVLEAIAENRRALADQLRAGQRFAPDAITVARAGDGKAPEVGSTIAELATASSREWAETMIGLVERYDASIDVIVVGTRDGDADRVLRLPYVSVASDGVALSMTHDANMPHPRSAGTFPKAFRQLVDGGIAVQEAIRKMTSMPAEKLGLEGRGVLKEGAAADLVLFDAQRFRDTATYADPLSAPTGVDSVWVNGQRVVESGVSTGLLPGRLLRRVK